MGLLEGVPYKFVDWDWYDWAACQGQPSETFFLDQPGDTGRFAKPICAGCPVRGECLWTALHNDEGDAVWGGLTHKERKDILRTSGWRGLSPQELVREYPVVYRRRVVEPCTTS